VETHIAILYSYSFLKRGNKDSIMIHPLVHVWARERMDAETKWKECEAALKMIISTTRASEGHRYIRTTDRWGLERRLLTHIDIALSWILTAPALEDLISRNTAMWMDCGNLYYLHKRYADANKFYKWALDHRIKSHGMNHLETSRTKLGLALSYRQEERHEEASKLLEQCLPVFEMELGINAYETCETLRALADSRKQQSRLSEAFNLIERAVTGYKNVLGPQHPQTLMALEIKSLIYKALGQHKKSLDIIDQILIVNIEQLGSEHPNTLRNMMNKANILISLGLLVESKDLFERVFRSAEAQFGPLDPFTLKTIHNLAFSTYSLQKYSEAEPLCELAIAGQEKTFGKSHILTLSSVELLGVIYHRQGLVQKGRACLLSALAGYKASSSRTGSISVYRTLHYLAQVCVSQGELLDAKHFYQEALKGHEKLLGSQHEATLRVAGNFTDFCQSQGWEDDAASINRIYSPSSEEPSASSSP
jgi:tetratricopeptide (TPR) repeat protein